MWSSSSKLVFWETIDVMGFCFCVEGLVQWMGEDKEQRFYVRLKSHVAAERINNTGKKM